jgi:hypothetical protein
MKMLVGSGGQGHRTPYEAVRYTRLCANMYIVTNRSEQKTKSKDNGTDKH